MNIIKFKDQNIEGDELFNEKFKGKNCFALHWLVAIPCEEISLEEFILLSKKWEGGEIGQYSNIEINSYIEYVDTKKTNELNNVDFLVWENQKVYDKLSLDELKKFRTWLATTLLEFATSQKYEEDTKLMLEYYKGGMNDNTISSLQIFAKSTTKITSQEVTTCCSCQTPSTTYGIDISPMVVCDPEAIYRDNIRLKMINVFSDMEFWKNKPNEFLDVFGQYIEGILQNELPLTNNQIQKEDKYCECGTPLVSQNVQKQMEDVLKNLLESINFIKTNNISSHKNFISTSLSNWSSQLYEHMEWA